MTISKEYLEKITRFRNQKTERTQAPREGLSFWFPTDGTDDAILRVLPGRESDGGPGLIVKTHKNTLPTDEYKKDKINCFAMYNLECPMCKMLHKYDDQEKIIEPWIPTTKAFITALILQDNTYHLPNRFKQPLDPKRPHIWIGNDINLWWILDCVMNPLIGDPTDPRKGFNILLKREKQMGKFNRQILPHAGPIAPTEEGIQEILDQMPEYNKIWKQPDDVYNNLMLAQVKMIEDIIQNKILTLSKTIHSIPEQKTTQQTAPTAGNTPSAADSALPGATPQTTVTEAPKTVPAPSEQKSTRPPGSPECYSDASIYSETSKKCIMCASQFQCEKAIAASKK